MRPRVYRRHELFQCAVTGKRSIPAPVTQYMLAFNLLRLSDASDPRNAARRATVEMFERVHPIRYEPSTAGAVKL